VICFFLFFSFFLLFCQVSVKQVIIVHYGGEGVGATRGTDCCHHVGNSIRMTECV